MPRPPPPTRCAVVTAARRKARACVIPIHKEKRPCDSSDRRCAADTPQPATPYQAAAQVWDDRIGSSRVQAKNWRFMAFGCLLLALLMAGGLVWRSAQSIVTPYVIEVDQAGQVDGRRSRHAVPARRCADRFPSGAFRHAGSLAVHRPDRGAAELARCL